MLVLIVGFLFALFGVATREFTIDGLGSCFAVDLWVVDLGRACFRSGSIVPKLAEYGSLALGVMMIGIGGARLRYGHIKPD